MVEIVNKVTKTTEYDALEFTGSYGNSEIGAKNDATHDQDFYGGVVVHSDPDNENDTLTMFGNAWKAYKLSEPFEVTKSSFLEFKYTLTEEAEGHGICLDEGVYTIVIFDAKVKLNFSISLFFYIPHLTFNIHKDLNEDTFGGAYTRCIMLAGTQVDRWGGIKKYNLASIEGTVAQQKSNRYFLIGDADKAIDGLAVPHWDNNERGVFNSISRTLTEDDPWWEVILTDNYEIHDIIIHNTQDALYIDELSDFTISLHGDDGLKGSDDTSTIWKKTYEVKEAFSKFHIPVRSDAGVKIGKRIRITLNKKEASLQLSEVEIMGKKACQDNDICSQNVRVPIGDLFAGSNTTVKYISFIQDNDKEYAIGESEFSEIQLITEEPKLVVSRAKMCLFVRSWLLLFFIEITLSTFVNMLGPKLETQYS